MTFSVDPTAVHGYAGLLARAGSDAEQCKEYFAEQVPDLTPVSEGLINPLCYIHEGVENKVGEMLDRLVTLLETSREELAGAATRYSDSDQGAAAKLDDSYPVVPRPSIRTD